MMEHYQNPLRNKVKLVLLNAYYRVIGSNHVKFQLVVSSMIGQI